MGTTLTGTTPQDTYDSLIKVTDNGPISGTLKALSDGLGNDSTLSLSTTAASIAGTLAVSGDFSIADKIVHIGDTNTAIRFPAADTITAETSGSERLRIASDGNVGIGVTPQSWFNTRRAIETFNGGALAGVNAGWMEIWGNSYLDAAGADRYLQTGAAALYQSGNVASGGHVFFTAPSGSAGAAVTFVERARIDNDGLKFNGDTAAANALDDYEEGTWTMGVAFGGASVGVTYTSNTGTYTKIGRQVMVNGIVVLSSKGSSTGDALLTGLPFTIPNAGAHLPPATLWLNRVTFLNQHQAVGKLNSTSVEFWDITTLGATAYLNNTDFANNSEIIINMTYFV
jgi:hypothetical protein